jgi:hypothetical protein
MLWAGAIHRQQQDTVSAGMNSSSNRYPGTEIRTLKGIRTYPLHQVAGVLADISLVMDDTHESAVLSAESECRLRFDFTLADIR